MSTDNDHRHQVPDARYSLSIEAGQRIDLGENWSITPQAQLAYSSVDFDGFTDTYGVGVSLNRSNSLIGRLGITADYNAAWQDMAGWLNRSHLYGIANLYNDFAGRSKINVAGVGFSSRDDRLYGSIGVGGSLNWMDDKYSLYGEANWKASLENPGASNSIGGTVGFRARW